MKGKNPQPAKAQKSAKISKIKLNVNFIDFVATVIEQKLMTKDKETLKQMYIDAVKVKSATNINRVAERTKREKLRAALEKVLEKKNLSFAKYDKTATELVAKIRERKGSNYIEA